MKLRTKIASGLIGAFLLTGVASPAFAVTKTNCYNTHTNTYVPITYCDYKYNWFERNILGRVDGRYYEYRAVWA